MWIYEQKSKNIALAFATADHTVFIFIKAPQLVGTVSHDGHRLDYQVFSSVTCIFILFFFINVIFEGRTTTHVVLSLVIEFRCTLPLYQCSRNITIIIIVAPFLRVLSNGLQFAWFLFG